MLLGAPPAIRSPSGDTEVLESEVPLPPKSHLGQGMEFEVPPCSAEQECCGRTLIIYNGLGYIYPSQNNFAFCGSVV